jgi:choline dehydrogenase-like flavoprotein
VAKPRRVLIVGSGAGGATVALELARQGHSVTIVEEGQPVQYDRLHRNISRATTDYYRYGGALPILAKPMVAFVEGKAVGGTTTINGGLFWRTPRFVLQRWRGEERVSDELVDAYDRHFTELESIQNVTFFNPPTGNLDSRAMKAGADALGWKAVEVPRSLKGCQQANRCPAGCPTGAKRSVDLTCLKEAEARGVELLTGLRAVEIKHAGGAFKSLSARASTGEKRELQADDLFLCAGAIQTPSLLRASGVKRNIGDTLSLHVNLKFLVYFKAPVHAENGTMFTYQVQQFIEDGILMMPTNFNRAWALGAVESRLPIASRDMDRLLSHSAIITTQVRPSGRGKVRRLGPLGTLASFDFVPEDFALMTRALRLSAELFFASGATHFYPPIAEAGPVSSLEEFDRQLSAPGLASRLELISVHAMASCPMGGDDRFPVDHAGLLRGFSNIRVADASVLPTNVGESPQGTIMYFARHISEQFCHLHG